MNVVHHRKRNAVPEKGLEWRCTACSDRANGAGAIKRCIPACQKKLRHNAARRRLTAFKVKFRNTEVAVVLLLLIGASPIY